MSKGLLTLSKVLNYKVLRLIRTVSNANVIALIPFNGLQKLNLTRQKYFYENKRLIITVKSFIEPISKRFFFCDNHFVRQQRSFLVAI